MTSNSTRSLKITPAQWDSAKPDIARLYLHSDLPMKEVIEMMKEKGFSATEGQYRAKFNKWGPAWKKNEKREDLESVAIELTRRKGEDIDLYQWGEPVTKDRISKIIQRSRPPTHNRFRIQALPKGFVIRTRSHDLTQKLIIGLPFSELEDSLCRQAFPHDFIDPRLLMSQDGTQTFELRDILRLQQGLQPQLHESPNSLIFKLLNSSHSALSSILPRSNNQLPIGDSSISNTGREVLLSPIHRQVLCSIGNSLAGLGALPIKQLLQLLKHVSSPDVFRLILSTPDYSSQTIAQQVLKGAIEVGNGPLVDAILSHESLQIDINEQICEAEGHRYTALERASMLHFKEVIRVMLRHGADVHKTYYPDINVFLSGFRICTVYGALNFAIHSAYNSRVDPEIFQVILGRSRYINRETLEFLIHRKEDEFMLSVVSKFAATSHEQWSEKYGCIWSRMIGSLTQETSMQLLNKMHELGVAMNTKVLNAAARSGHQELVQMLLNDGLAPNKYSLCDAIKSENEAIVRILLENGATVHDVSDYNDGDPFSNAVQTQNSQIIDLLVEKGALKRLNQREPWIATWKAAVNVGDMKLIEKLIGMREDISARHLGCALVKASGDGNYEMAVLLLDLGADVEVERSERRRNEYRFALCAAITANSLSLVKLLLDSGANPNHHAASISPIVVAARWGNHLAVEALLVAGAKPTNEALTAAAGRKDRDLMDMLLNAGADIDHGPLVAATKAGDFDTGTWLLDHGADPHSSQALENAFLFNSPFFDTLLLAHKERYPLGRKGFGSSVLSKAVQNRDESTVKHLLDNGADPSHLLSLYRKDEQNVTPFFYAIVIDGGRNTSFVNLFLDRWRSPKYFGCDPECVVCELKESARGSSWSRITALLAVIGTESKLMVQLFLREGANINFPAISGIKRTPLQRAAEIGSFEMVQLCYNSGADVNAPPNRIGGATSLQLAAIGGYNAIVIYLLSRKADVDAPGALINGMTALEGAAANGRTDTIAILLRAKAGHGGSDLSQFQRAIALANHNGHFPVRNMLKAHLQSITQQSQVVI